MNKKQEEGVIVPFSTQAKKKTIKEWVFCDSKTFWFRQDLNLTEKGLLTLLRCYCNRAGQAWPTMEQLASNSGLHVETVEIHLASLCRKGELSWQSFRDEDGHKRRLYQVQLFQNPWGKITPMAHGGKNPPLTVTIVNKKLFVMAAWCREDQANPSGCDEQSVKRHEARHGPA